MDSFWHLLETTTPGSTAPGPEAIVLSLLLAFVLGQFLAWAYRATHSGLSYSRTFTQSLSLISMSVALLIILIGDNVTYAFGLIGVMAMIRFRNVLKDTRDAVFIFLALAQGMGVGSQHYATAITGTAVLMLALFYIH